MADIYGSHFEYAGKMSRQYGLIIATIGTERMLQLGGTKESISLFSKKAKRQYLMDDDYSGAMLSFDIEFVTDNERLLELSERRAIEKWLFNKREYCKLYFDIADDLYGETFEYIDGARKRNYLNCRFVNPEKLEYNGGIVGYKATLEADSNMFWQDAIEKSYSVGNAYEDISSVISVTVDSDIDDYVYPKVTINMGGVGGDIIISNNSDDSTRLTKFVGLSPYATIVMKGELNYVSGQYYEKFAKQNFIRLLDGENKLTVMGNVDSMKIEFQNRRSL